MHDAYLLPLLVPLSLVAAFAGGVGLWLFPVIVALAIAEIVAIILRQ